MIVLDALLIYTIGVFLSFIYLILVNKNRYVLIILHIYLLISLILPYIAIVIDIFYRLVKYRKSINTIKDYNLK